ncbi:MAG: transporter [Massilia sp.]
MKAPLPTLIAVLLGAALAPAAMASCGSAFCTVNTNWTAESASAEASSSFDLRYESINQDQPYSGSDRVAIGQVAHHHDEVSTFNRNLLASYSHNFGSGWGLTVSAPLGQRNHQHVHNHHGAKLGEEWRFTELGDVRVSGRYQLLEADNPLAPSFAGVTFGLKLPSGKIDKQNDAGSVAERSLQPGTGTTDLLLGGYYHRKLVAADASWFVQGQYQQALNSHANYKPGAQTGLDVGVRKGVGEKLAVLLQLNLLHKSADSGSEAEPADSGGRFAFLSPGVAYALTGNMQLYGFVQQPLYRHVNGVQLTAPRAFLIGVSGRL